MVSMVEGLRSSVYSPTMGLAGAQSPSPQMQKARAGAAAADTAATPRAAIARRVLRRIAQSSSDCVTPQGSAGVGYGVGPRPAPGQARLTPVIAGHHQTPGS